MVKEIILASGSPRRHELLGKIGVSHQVCPSVKEEVRRGNLPQEVACHLAREKALEVAKKWDNGVIIGADTIVVYEGKILGKPKDKEQAKEMLSCLSGKTHQVMTGVYLCEKKDGKQVLEDDFVEITKVTMFSLTQKEIENYVKTGDSLDKAGAYGIQGMAAVFVEKIEGDYNNVVGLPLARVYRSLRDHFQAI